MSGGSDGKLELLRQSCVNGEADISSVDLSNSGLTVFPLQDLLPLRHTLEVLNLGGNRLSSLPDEIAQFRKLRVLFFANNDFTSVPSVLGGMPSLFMLSFKSNRVEIVPEDSLSPSLGWLILTDNKIRQLPASIGRLSGLRKCMLAANELRELPAEMAQCRQLELLRIAANRIKALPDWLLQLPRLSWLAFAGNPLCAASQAAGAEALGSLRAIDYRELQMGAKLGEGASGIVYQARWSPSQQEQQEHQQLETAVKMFKSGATSDGLPEDEMQAMLAAGTHPHCTQVLGRVVNAPGDALGLVLPLIPPAYSILGNPPSFQSVTRDTFAPAVRFNLSTIVRVARGILSVCAHLHGRGISHGDLYAHNILADPSGSPLLSDFGAASFYAALPAPSAAALQAIEVSAFGWLLEDMLGRVELSTEGEGKAGLERSKRVVALERIQRQCVEPELALRPRFEALGTMFASL